MRQLQRSARESLGGAHNPASQPAARASSARFWLADPDPGCAFERRVAPFARISGSATIRRSATRRQSPPRPSDTPPRGTCLGRPAGQPCTRHRECTWQASNGLLGFGSQRRGKVASIAARCRRKLSRCMRVRDKSVSIATRIAATDCAPWLTARRWTDRRWSSMSG